MERIYLDHAATTYMDSRVKSRMDKYYSVVFGNPSSIYEEGRLAKEELDSSRREVASILGVGPHEVYFTGGGSESDNLAVLGVSRAYKSEGDHVITSKIEHHAVLHAVNRLEKEGFTASYAGVDKDGVVDISKIKSDLNKFTVLVSVMYVNNEIGTIQPIKEIAKIIRDFKKSLGRSETQPPFFHTDAIQAAAYFDINPFRLGADLMTLNGSKIYGPKGVGMLYAKRGIRIEPLIYGGGQERGTRSGTENVAGIAGFCEALRIVREEKEKEAKRLFVLRNYLVENILKMIPDTALNGSLENGAPHIANFSFFGVEGESLVLYLDAKGIACSTGSACNSASLEPSHVIMELKKPPEYAHGSARFSFGKKTKKEDLDYLLSVLPPIISRLREMSALDKNYEKRIKERKENKNCGCR
jgi:cysteine desulfurase